MERRGKEEEEGGRVKGRKERRCNRRKKEEGSGDSWGKEKGMEEGKTGKKGSRRQLKGKGG